MTVTDIPFAAADTGSVESSALPIGPPHFCPQVTQTANRLRAPHLEGQLVTIERIGNQSILRGTVQTFFQKQMAQETARLASPDTTIVNQIQVRGVENASVAPSTDNF